MDLAVTISAPGIAPGQYFGQVMLEDRNGDRDLHIPVAFSPGQGALTLTQACDPTTLTRPAGRSTCTVTAENTSRTAATVDATTHLDEGLRVTGVSGATQTGPRDAAAIATLAGVAPGTPTVAPGELFGYIPLDAFGVAPIPVRVNNWLVIEWRLNVFGTSSLRVFQAWIGLNGVEDNTFAYDPGNLPAPTPAGINFPRGRREPRRHRRLQHRRRARPGHPGHQHAVRPRRQS